MKEMINKLFHVLDLLAITLLVSGCNIIKPVSQKATLPFEWPVAPLSEEQINAVKDCNLENLINERYPETIKINDLKSAFQPKSECDWAVLAFAYAKRTGENDELPEAGIDAFSQVIKNNYGFALATPIFYRYFGATSIVKQPPFTKQAITNVKIQYEWSGLGKKVDYLAEISQANTSPRVKITPDSMATSEKINIDKKLIQALSPTLDNLLPIKSKFSVNPCTDNYPQWSVQITFRDSTTLNLTSDSNFIPIGGPWETEIEQQNYILFSTAFISALDKVITSMKLPYGQPAAWTCFGDEVFDKAFPLHPVTPEISTTTPEDSTVWWTTWLTQPACKSPCWQNITPGVTTIDEAISILEKMQGTTITYNKNNGVEWDFGSTKTDCGWLNAEGGIVNFVILSSVDDNLTLETVVASYGFPNFVVPEDCRDGMCDTVLVYPDIGIWLNVFIENKGGNSNSIKVEIHPDTIVYRVHFEERGIENFKQSYLSPQENVPIMTWKGYGSYP